MAASADTSVTAVWDGPSQYQLFDGTLLVPGETVCEIGADEAQDNPYWKVTSSKSAKPVNATAWGNEQDVALQAASAEASSGDAPAPAPEPPALTPPTPEVGS